MDDVHLAADAPARPLRCPARFEDPRVGLVELDVEVLQDGVPEPLEVFWSSGASTLEWCRCHAGSMNASGGSLMYSGVGRQTISPPNSKLSIGWCPYSPAESLSFQRFRLTGYRAIAVLAARRSSLICLPSGATPPIRLFQYGDQVPPLSVRSSDSNSSRHRLSRFL